MANRDNSIQTCHDLIEETAKMNISPAAKSLTILRLAEAAAWLNSPSNAHGGIVELPSAG
jgi:hypothetical protein